MDIKGVIFDLDGVILSTDNYHYLAWKKMADKEGIYFDREINERLRGVSRMASLEIILEKAEREYTDEEKKELAEYKNNIYRESLKELSPSEIFSGVMDFLDFLQEKNIAVAVGSSSKNTKFILERVQLTERFKGAVSDGTNITKSKPDPEVFIKAAQMINVAPENCLVLEDADAGVEAAKNGNMIAMGIGPAQAHPDCDLKAEDVRSIDRSIFN
ncbi:MAG TPA: beta-phosphoglucomutase [Spirochaetota bacterium]|nr:beta-phosphoglucomutase [Spirochaetota bacterium]